MSNREEGVVGRTLERSLEYLRRQNTDGSFEGIRRKRNFSVKKGPGVPNSILPQIRLV